MRLAKALQSHRLIVIQQGLKFIGVGLKRRCVSCTDSLRTETWQQPPLCQSLLIGVCVELKCQNQKLEIINRTKKKNKKPSHHCFTYLKTAV